MKKELSPDNKNLLQLQHSKRLHFCKCYVDNEWMTQNFVFFFHIKDFELAF